MTDYESKPPSISLWNTNSERGPMATGNNGSIRWVLWPNDKRGNERAPDWRLVMEAVQKRDEQRPQEQPQSSGAPAGGAGLDDEIPFSMEWRL